MNKNRLMGLLLAGTAICSVASGAYALDGNDVLAKVNAVSSPNGMTIAAKATSVDGSTVKLSGVTMTLASADSKVVPIGDVTLEGVEEDNGGYTIEKASFSDLNAMESGSGISATDIYAEGVRVPADPKPGTIDSLLMTSSFHVGPTKIIEKNKDVASIEEMTGSYTIADDKTKIEAEGKISGLKIDTTGTPDPKAQEAINALGLQTISGEIAMKGSWTLADGKMDVTEYSFDFADIGRLDVNFSISGYTLELIKSMQEAMKAAEANPDKAAGQQALGMSMMGLMQQLVYNSSSIRFDDAGITAKVLDYAGKQQGVDGKQFAQSIKAMLPMILAQMNMPDLQSQIVNAANVYLDDPKSLQVASKPGQPLPFPQIMGAAMGNPADLTRTLNVQITANE